MGFAVELNEPTAVQAESEVHETPLSSSRFDRSDPTTGLGLGWIDQLDPFHTSTRVGPSTALSAANPTAVHAEAEVHEIAWR
jgi:hypothetical protein